MVGPCPYVSDQVGFVKGGPATDGTCRTLNLLRLPEVLRIPTDFIALDAERAFGRVHWGYLHATLAKFGISGFILSAIMALYTNPSAHVFMSLVPSDNFAITNGTKQGCPILFLYFPW